MKFADAYLPFMMVVIFRHQDSIKDPETYFKSLIGASDAQGLIKTNFKEVFAK